MRAAIYRRYGPPSVIQIVDVDKPDIKATQMLVKVRATTVTAGDSRLRSARVPRGFAVLMRLGFGILGPRKPILGWELAGEVVAVGQSVSRFALGDTVFAARMGSHAEYVAVPEDVAAPMPRNLRFEDAAALSFGGLTSLFYLRDKARIQPGERVLINGASGAVGSAAVQLAKHFGAVVTGVCSAANAQLVTSLGADRVIDYTAEDFTKDAQTYDVVLDAVGKSSFGRCRRLLAPRGIYVSSDLGFLAQNPILAFVTPLFKQRVLFPIPPKYSRARVEGFKAMLGSGEFTPVIDRRYPLDQIVEAYRYVETGQKIGNVVIDVDIAS